MMSKNLLLIIVGLLIFFISFALYIAMPLYLPYYHEIDTALISHENKIEVPPQSTIKIVNLTANNYNNTVYVITNSSNVNVYVFNNRLTLIGNNSGYIAIEVNPGNYIVALNNPTPNQQYVNVHYAVLPYSHLNEFYTYSGIISTVTEFFMALGVVIAGYSTIKTLLGRKISSAVNKITKKR